MRFSTVHLKESLGRRFAGRFLVLILSYPLLTMPLYAQGKARTTEFESLSAKADAARSSDRLDEAVVLYRKALTLKPDWGEGWWSLGTIQYDRNNYAEAAHAFKKLTVLNPKAGTARVMLGLCEFELGQDNDALHNIEEGKRIGIQKDQQLRQVMLYHEGILLQRGGKFEAARDTLEQLCLEGVQSDEVARILGMVSLRKLDKNPPPENSPDGRIITLAGRAGCLAGQKKYDEARAALSAVADEHPDYPNIHYAYGLLLIEARDTVSAVEEFKREIKNNPDHVYARLQIAAARYKVDSAAGLPFAEEAVRLDPQLPFGHYLLGLLLLDTDNYRKAIPELEIAQKTFPREAAVYFALGSAYSRAGRREDAARARAAFERLNQPKTDDAAAGEKAGAQIDAKPPI